MTFSCIFVSAPIHIRCQANAVSNCFYVDTCNLIFEKNECNAFTRQLLSEILGNCKWHKHVQKGT